MVNPVSRWILNLSFSYLLVPHIDVAVKGARRDDAILPKLRDKGYLVDEIVMGFPPVHEDDIFGQELNVCLTFVRHLGNVSCFLLLVLLGLWRLVVVILFNRSYWGKFIHNSANVPFNHETHFISRVEHSFALVVVNSSDREVRRLLLVSHLSFARILSLAKEFVFLYVRLSGNAPEINKSIEIGWHEDISVFQEFTNLNRRWSIELVVDELQNTLLSVGVVIEYEDKPIISTSCAKLILLLEVQKVDSVLVLVHSILLWTFLQRVWVVVQPYISIPRSR